jgi:hypothetical protein
VVVALLAYDGAEDRRQAAYTRDLEQALSSACSITETPILKIL